LSLIDLRSDTVTLPTPEMREAIARAELGDDVYGEDPTVNRLEALAASMTGKEAALLVPSGTMGNLAAMLTHCARGTKAIVGSESHTNLYEAGGASALGGIVLTPIANTEAGELELDALARELATSDDSHFAQPSLVVLENTHNRCGGAPVKLSHMAEVSDAAHRRKLPMHLDGARIFNAAVALETTAKDIASFADTVSLCLSKGLSCPVGSLLCGSREFIARAHRTRKVLGGGNRRADDDGRSAGRRSSECTRARARLRAGGGLECPPGCESDQHGGLRRRWRREDRAPIRSGDERKGRADIDARSDFVSCRDASWSRAGRYRSRGVGRGTGGRRSIRRLSLFARA